MIVKEEHELHKRRRRRNLALGGVLLAFVLLVFAVTIVKLANGQMIKAF
ncbi:hypothetical protein [Oceanicella actignis]|uniref:Cytochrome C oxidase assembly protein n=1 Tax=Oceanicella actignis TaxID=1189325 RepID=A0A1M7TJM0_9RHOB|nr:hypothetical protein [Oceanicella actignis]TYO88173.1 hypothetical protein LY05_02322 [Oceanicella actignis]SET66649.1 hypothetical protein SAMN04488119_10747 [Oceanicella actignis]SHN70886.1 hypothetical protein SAMN05216200_10746 [Oceanicella actignis]